MKIKNWGAPHAIEDRCIELTFWWIVRVTLSPLALFSPVVALGSSFSLHQICSSLEQLIQRIMQRLYRALKWRNWPLETNDQTYGPIKNELDQILLTNIRRHLSRLAAMFSQNDLPLSNRPSLRHQAKSRLHATRKKLKFQG